MAVPFSYFENSALDFFDAKRTGSNFDLTSIAGSLPTEGYYIDGTDQDKLAKAIVEARKNNTTLKKFYYKEYLGKDAFITNTYSSMGYPIATTTYYKEKIDINSRNQDPTDDLKTFWTRVNTKIDGEVENSPSFLIVPDIDSGKATYTIYFNYTESTAKTNKDEYINIQSRNYDTGEVTGSKKRIIAIEFETTNYGEFAALCQMLQIDMDRYVIYSFSKRYKSLDKNELWQVNNFYEQAPLLYLQTLSVETLFSDFKILLKYDKSKWFIDNSPNMLKSLTAIMAKESGMEFLYKVFNQAPQDIKDIYYYLDGSGVSTEYEGQEIPNKSIFASMLMTICNYNAQGYNEERMHSGIVFRTTNGFKVDSNVLMSYDQSDQVFDLTQESQHFKTERRNIGGFMDGSASIEYADVTEEYWTRGTTHHLHPLDIVTLIIEGRNNEEFRIIVPAIFVKDMAFHREWTEIEKMIRIGIDIFIIVISIATLVAGPGPLMATLSLIDLGLATTDIGIQAFEKEIRKMDGGPEFLDAWEKIYLIGGFVTALPMLGTVLRNGAKILLKVTSAEVRTQLVSMLKYAIKGVKVLPKFVRGQFEIITDFTKALGANIGNKMQLLANEGVLLIKGIKEGDKGYLYSLIYRGIVLKTDDFKKIAEEISEITKKGKNSLVKYLDQLYYSKAGTGGTFKYLTESPSLKMFCQEEPMSCAAACIRQLAKENGKIISEEVARTAAKTDGLGTGTSLNNIRPALKEILDLGDEAIIGGHFNIDGLNDFAEGAKIISSAKKPWIATLKSTSGMRHTVIVDKITDNIVYIRDPWETAIGYGAKQGVEATMKLEDFTDFWKGSLFHFVLIK